MNIVSSEAIYDTNPQPSGLIYVRERYVDKYGIVYECGPYLIPPGFDMQTRLNENAAVLSEQLANNEAQGILNGAGT